MWVENKVFLHLSMLPLSSVHLDIWKCTETILMEILSQSRTQLCHCWSILLCCQFHIHKPCPLSTISPINAMRPVSWRVACHGKILTLYLALLLMEFHKTKLAAPGAFWGWRKWWRQAVHVVATVTIITEEQLILLGTIQYL